MAEAAGSLPRPVTFEEVAIYFAPEEWEELAGWQKALYKDVMRDNYEMLSSLDLADHKPEIILRMERGEEPWLNRCPDAKTREESNPDFPGVGQIQIKKESGLEDKPAGLACHAGPLEALKGSLDNGTIGGLSPWSKGHLNPIFCVNGTAALGPWPMQLRWPNCAMADGQVAPVEFQAGHPGASGSGFWPAGGGTAQLEEMLLICTQCQKCFPARSAQGLSSVAPRGGLMQICPECQISTVKDSPVVTDQPSHIGASPCTCAHCLPPLTARPRLPKEERPYKCGKCDRSFRFVHEYTWHQKVHAGEKIYKCNTCEKVFRHKQELMWHQRAHTTEWPHKCGACEKNFRFKQELTWHLKTHSAERPYKCPECEKSFRFKQEFMWHQRAHVGDRPYKCTECEKSFRFKQEFTWHQRSHAGEKTYKCPGCDKSFRYKQEFIWHQRIHTGEQPYPCASCDSTFTCRQEYMRHQRLHDGEKPYQCPHCEKTFRRGSTLIRHRRIHLGEGALKCAHCDRTFGQSANLIKHQRMHALKSEPGENAATWGPCLQGSAATIQQDARSVLSLKTVSVGALLLLNLQEPKLEKQQVDTSATWETPM
ncbi:zinc finger protein 34-like [Sceloporus undulatus]|uniref:zinc finger protein 34-like n=1 Tax=Sceloporus undulatus TaxID=8520 RepID=UPI001C4D073F|nr:zinc finger protein 34-like [Sceloporus undulatus]XP_042298075.1 zinc finger protein 34-like [Sceloporus undulatus]XP_042298076.1 zinc finger protein 34-like [Sceloporus undulatus]